MPSSSTISHYRLNSGCITIRRRDAAEDRFIGILEPLLSPGSHKLPNTEGYAVDVSIAGNMLIGTIDSSDGSLFRMWVVADGRDLARVVRPPRVLDAPLPACIVEVLKDLRYDPLVGWLQSFVDSLAWAWIRHVTDPRDGEPVSRWADRRR